MDKAKRNEANASLFLCVGLNSLILIMDWAYRCDLFEIAIRDLYTPIFSFFKQWLPEIRWIHIIFVALLGYVNTKTDVSKKINKPFFIAVAVFSSGLFLIGYTQFIWYNVILYPAFFLSTSIFVLKSIQYISSKTKEAGVLETVSEAEVTTTSFEFNTDKGKLVIPNAEHGIWIESGPGGGKTVLIDNLLYQAIQKDFALYVYDFEGNPVDTDETNNREGTILSRTVYTALKIRKSKTKLKFAFLNFVDLGRTVKCNPYSPRYIQSKLDIIELNNTLMKNLEKEWVTKTDFWAKYAINLVTGAHLWLHKHRPEFSTIPHLVTLMLSDINAVLSLLEQDKELESWILPVLTAYRNESSNQLSGVITTSQLPLTQLYVPEIFYVLNPAPAEDFDLDITKKENPVCFCVGNNGMKQNAALGPVIALISTVVSKNMNQFNRHKAMFCVDEGDTIYIPNIDIMPATIRKKGVITTFAIQTFNQTIDRYGEIGAKKLRDNLNNQFIGKTNNHESAERMVKMFGEYKKTEFSQSQGDSGESQTASIKKESYIQISDVSMQNTGHFTGYVSNGNPPRFHAQFENFVLDKLPIPRFSMPSNTGNVDFDNRVLRELIDKNFIQIRKDIDSILPVMPAKSE